MSEGYSSWQQDVVIPGSRGKIGAGRKGGGQEMLLALWRASLAHPGLKVILMLGELSFSGHWLEPMGMEHFHHLVTTRLNCKA